jgi:hypothetical protein
VLFPKKYLINELYMNIMSHSPGKLRKVLNAACKYQGRLGERRSAQPVEAGNAIYQNQSTAGIEVASRLQMNL